MMQQRRSLQHAYSHPQLRPLVRSLFARGTVGGFSPDKLFSSNEQGLVAIPSNLSGMYQDSGMTQPVTAAGQTVAKMLDASGRGNTITFTNVTLGQDEFGFYYLSTNAGGTSTGSTASVNLGSSQVSVFAAVRPLGAAASGVVSFGNISAQTGAFELQYYLGGNGQPLMYRRGSGAFGARALAAPPAYETALLSCVVDLTGNSQATECSTFRLYGSQGAFTDFGSGDTGAGPFGNYPFSIFSSASGSAGNNWIGRLYGLILLGRTATAGEISSVEGYLAARCPPQLNSTYTPQAADFADSFAPVAGAGGQLLTSPFAHVDLATTATIMEIRWNSTIYSSYPSLAQIGVYINGVYNQVVTAAAGNELSRTIFLPPGNKIVSLVNGPTSRPGAVGSEVAGTYLTAVRANAPMVAQAPSPTGRVLYVGDSITVGAFADNAEKEAFVMLIRSKYYPNSLAVEGYGFRALHDDVTDSASATAFANKLAAYNPNRIVLNLGTNDYGLNYWNASAFGTAYGLLLDAIHTALPSATVFCQSPIMRSDEGSTNGSGSTIADYRGAISTQVSTRTSFCTYVNGLSILTYPTGYADGVHPNTAGHAAYAVFDETVLGI